MFPRPILKSLPDISTNFGLAVLPFAKRDCLSYGIGTEDWNFDTHRSKLLAMIAKVLAKSFSSTRIGSVSSA